MRACALQPGQVPAVVADEDHRLDGGGLGGGEGPPSEFLAAEGRAEDDPREWYGDSAYGTGDLRGAIDDTDADEAVIKPKPVQAPVEGGFTIDDFTVNEPTDEQAGTVCCPAGHTRPISKTRVATFGVLCRDCPLRARCTTSKTGRRSSSTSVTTCSAKPAVTGKTSPSYARSTARSDPNVERVIS